MSFDMRRSLSGSGPPETEVRKHLSRKKERRFRVVEMAANPTAAQTVVLCEGGRTSWSVPLNGNLYPAMVALSLGMRDLC